MPITWEGGSGRIDIVFSDPYTVQDSERAMKEIFARPDLTRPLRFLVDVRRSTPPDREFVANAITFWQLHVDKMWGAKVAVLTATDSQTRKAELSDDEAQSRGLPFTVRGFPESDLDAALSWLDAVD